MAIFSIPNIRMSGLAVAVPQNRFSNEDYDWLSVAERKKLIKTTGVIERRIAPEDVTSSDLCEEATNHLIEKLQWEPTSVDVLIFVCQMRDYIVPSTSPILQDKLELSSHCMAFDVPLGCSGYVYGLSIACSLLSHPGLNRALLLAGDVTSRNNSYYDKTVHPLCGDAGSVTALEKDDHIPPMHFHMQTDGSGYDTIIIPHGGLRQPTDHSSLEPKEEAEGVIRTKLDYHLQGEKLLEFTMREVIPNIEQLLTSIQIDQHEIDYYIFHQANLLMNEMLRKTLQIEEKKVPYSLPYFGNTIAASIPLTMVTELREKLQNQQLKILLSGFGVGLSWGSAYLTVDKPTVLPLIET